MTRTVFMGLAAIAACLMLFGPVFAQEAAPQAGCCDVGCCDGAGCVGDACCEAGCGGCCSSGIVIGAELLYLDVFAKQGAGGDMFSDAMADYDYEASFRIWAGYQLSNCLGIRFRYFTYDADGEWNQPEVDGLFLSPIVDEESLDIDMYDVELTDDLCIGCWELTPSIGVRWGEVELASPYTSMEVCGVGAVAGLDARRSICGCWSVYANGRYGVLYGETERELTNGLVDQQLVVRDLGADDTFFETIEMQIGVEWAKCCRTGNFFARAGWEQQVYLVDDMIGSRGADTGDISLAGPAFGIGLDR